MDCTQEQQPTDVHRNLQLTEVKEMEFWTETGTWLTESDAQNVKLLIKFANGAIALTELINAVFRRR